MPLLSGLTRTKQIAKLISNCGNELSLSKTKAQKFAYERYHQQGSKRNFEFAEYEIKVE